MPEVVFTSPGSNVTVYCAIQDARRNATNVRWWLNGQYPIPESQYRVINDYVSVVTWQTEAAGVDVLFFCEKNEERIGRWKRKRERERERKVKMEERER